ncbi:MAG TPA: hypothetical protein VNU23_05255 [Candidatus Cybelea sp.]|jgi:hypothetical protein|nr:hypothetical protein [Candidatus Cybelea sp.]
MARRAYSGYRRDAGKSLMHESQTISDRSAEARSSPASIETNKRLADTSRIRRSFLTLVGGALTFAALLLPGCGEEPAPKPGAETPAKPAEAAVPEEMQAAAQNLLGKETQVLVFGDLAKTGKQQFLAANVVPKTPKNDIPGTIVTRAVLAEETDGKWSELLHCDEYLKNAKGYLALTPIAAVAGWKVQYDQDPIKGIQLYFTPIKGPADPHVLPIGIAWNPATKRYQSLDLSYQHFLMEKPTLDTARSVLR